jgi:hypothetical protein
VGGVRGPDHTPSSNINTVPSFPHILMLACSGNSWLHVEMATMCVLELGRGWGRKERVEGPITKHTTQMPLQHNCEPFPLR